VLTAAIACFDTRALTGPLLSMTKIGDGSPPDRRAVDCRKDAPPRPMTDGIMQDPNIECRAPGDRL